MHVIICTKSHARKSWDVKREREGGAAIMIRQKGPDLPQRQAKLKEGGRKENSPAGKESNSTRRLWNKSGTTRKLNN